MRVIQFVVYLFFINSAFAQNLIPNGDFENGSTGWNGGQISTNNPHSGKYCMYVKDESANFNVAASSQIVNISQSDYYRFSLWYRSSTAGHKILVAINQYDSQGKWISGNNIDMPLVASDSWKSFQVFIRTFNPKTAMIRVNLYATLWSDRGELTGDAYYDDVVFERTSIQEATYGSYIFKNSDLAIWQSPVSQKVQKDMRPSDKNVSDKAEFFSSKGEYEAIQLVVTPSKDFDINGILLKDFTGQNGTLSSSLFKIYVARFVNVTLPTDISSLKGEIPDPLTEPDYPVPLKTNQSQPFYIIVKIPPETSAGEYESDIKFVFSDSSSAIVPIRLRIWDFEIPKNHSIRTAYGFNVANLDLYHNLSGNYQDIRQVAELYLLDMAEHRVSPFDPFLDDYYSVSVSLTGFIGGEVVTDTISGNTISGNHYLDVTDNSSSECVNSHYFKKIKIEKGTDYVLSWRSKGNSGEDYLVAINQYDANQKWISGANLDFVRNHNGDWNNESVKISSNQFRENTEYIGLRLYARRWTSDCGLTGKTSFDDIVFQKSGSNENLISNGDFEGGISNAFVDVDFSRFDKRAEYVFEGLGFDSFAFRLYHFAGGDWTGQYTDVDILGYKWGTREYEDLFSRITREVTRHLKEKDILKYAYTYWYDEPEEKDYELVKYGNELIHRAEPELKRLLTEYINPMLVGYVDIWVPILYEFDPLSAAERQRAGEEVFWYVCTAPRAPYPNYFIDHLAIEHRILFWMNWKYNVTGSLYWQINYWDDCVTENGLQNPYLDPQSYVCGKPQNVWGNGDGRLIYPPFGYTDGKKRITGPVSSIRWELIRDGIEDYEYFYLLKKLIEEAKGRGISSGIITDAEKLLYIPDEIVYSLTDYTKDPLLLENYRTMIGNTIEQLSLLLRSQILDAWSETSEEKDIVTNDIMIEDIIIVNDVFEDRLYDSVSIIDSDEDSPYYDIVAEEDIVSISDAGGFRTDDGLPSETSGTGCSCSVY